jgi:hypothetical protein
MSNALKLLIIAVAAVFACLILASALNSGKYYVTPTEEGVSIWKGDFSPRGKEKVIALKGVSAPEGVSGRVSKEEAYSLPFDYYMTRAQKLSEKNGVPDFQAIREELEKARKYAVSNKQMRQVRDRLNHIEFTFLLNKADMAAAKETPEGYEKALRHLQNARDLAVTPSQRELVTKQLRQMRDALNKAGKPGSGKPQSQPKKPEKEKGIPSKEKKEEKKETIT